MWRCANRSKAADVLDAYTVDIVNPEHQYAEVSCGAHLEAVKGPLGTQGAVKLHQTLGINGMCVDNDTLDVHQVSVVLQRPHVQPSLLTQLSDAGAVIVGQSPIGQDSVCYLRVGDQIDLQQLQRICSSPGLFGMSLQLKMSMWGKAASLFFGLPI